MLHIESEIGRSCTVQLPGMSKITKNYYRTKISYPVKLSTTSRPIYKVQVSDEDLLSLFRYKNKSTLFKVDYTGDSTDLCKLSIKSKVVSNPQFMNTILKFMNGLLDYYHFLELELPEDLIDPDLIKSDHRSKLKVKVTWFSTELDDKEDLLNISIFNL